MQSRGWRGSCAIATAALALAAGACGSHNPQPSGEARAAAPECPPAGTRTDQGGQLRLPAGAHPGATPLLVVVIPGGGGDRHDRLGLAREAGRHGIAVLYPLTGDGFWQLNASQGTSDLDAATALLERTLAGGCFDRTRVSITGVSNGAGFAARMACAQPTRFAAVVPVAAGYRALEPCSAQARASFMDIHGTADTVVPYYGKRPGRQGSVPRYASGWAQRDGCTPGPRTTTPRPHLTRQTYRGCDDGMRVELLRLKGTDHGWPGAGPPLPDHNPSGLDATHEVVRFVRTARRPPTAAP